MRESRLTVALRNLLQNKFALGRVMKQECSVIVTRRDFIPFRFLVSLVCQSDRELDGLMTDRLKELKLIDSQKLTISCSV